MAFPDTPKKIRETPGKLNNSDDPRLIFPPYLYMFYSNGDNDIV